MEDRLIVALDYPRLEPAMDMVRTLRGLKVGFKVGLELFTAGGPRVVEAVRAEGGRVFLDLKFHDIGATLEGACRAAAKLGVWMTNLHLTAGREGVRRGAAAARETALRLGEPPPLLLGVTVLTSLDETALRDDLGVCRPMVAQVLALARLGRDEGLDGVVASAREVAAIKAELGAGFLTVVPGVRPVIGGLPTGDDQRRSATPGEAIRRGADYLVVGRPINRAADPREAVERILAEMAGETKRD